MSKLFRQLVLCPDDPSWVSESTEDVCRAVGLIADAVDERERGRFYIGELFLQHINFMGCAPAIEFTPDAGKELDWQQFSFVHLSYTHAVDNCYMDLDLAKPQCPECHKRIRQPRLYLSNHNQALCCPHCQRETHLSNFDWREFGGCGQTMVSIVNVYPKEAIPTENLLLQFEKLTHVRWRYFYYHGPLINEN